jgi:type IV pilus assembly protein PilO
MAREPIWKAIWRINQKIPTVLGVLCLLNIGSYLLVTGIYEKRAEDLERQYISQQSEVRKAEQGGRSAESPLVVYARGSRDLQVFRQAIPVKQELTGLVGEIFDLATSSGLKIDRISWKPEHLQEMRLLQYGLGFNVTGTYNQIKKFTHKIEQSNRLLTIDSMSLNSGQQSGNVDLNLNLTTFFRAESL